MGSQASQKTADVPRPLAGFIAVEHVAADCPMDLRLSIGLAGRMLADLGVDVIKIEPADGDPLRGVGPFVGETSVVFAFLNAGKRSLRLADGGEGALERVIGGADILLRDSAATGAAPKRVEGICSLAPDGSSAGSEFTMMAQTGLLDIVGSPERTPLLLGGHQLAYSVGLALFTGTVAALCTDGNGPEVVRANFLDTGSWLNWKGVVAPSWGAKSPSRQGDDSEWRIVRCADGWIALVYRQDDWAAMKAFCQDARLDDPRFAARGDRRKHAAEVSAIIEEHLLGFTRREIRELTLTNRIPLGPVWTLEELQDDPQYKARNFLFPLRLGDGLTVPIPRLPVLWGTTAFAPGSLTAVDGMASGAKVAS
jgi:crotonobetainyl-CoA:carnitine CoA-transferase CaiB-like acyl-CoA transferase